MKNLVGIILILAGLFIGFYVGIWLFGVVPIIAVATAVGTDGFAVALGWCLAKIFIFLPGWVAWFVGLAGLEVLAD